MRREKAHSLYFFPPEEQLGEPGLRARAPSWRSKSGLSRAHPTAGPRRNARHAGPGASCIPPRSRRAPQAQPLRSAGAPPPRPPPRAARGPRPAPFLGPEPAPPPPPAQPRGWGRAPRPLRASPLRLGSLVPSFWAVVEAGGRWDRPGRGSRRWSMSAR